MNAQLAGLLTEIEAYVHTIFRNADTSKLMYHNYAHTANVVSHAKEIATHYQLSDEAIFTLLSAAWFHDTGHLYGDWQSHEERSADIASDYLDNKDLPEMILTGTRACIMATKMPVQPSGLLQEIICDADTWHLGTMDFFEKNERVWDEIEARLGIVIKNRVPESIRFLQHHQFYTGYCKEKLNEGKKRNIERLKSVLS